MLQISCMWKLFLWDRIVRFHIDAEKRLSHRLEMKRLNPGDATTICGWEDKREELVLLSGWKEKHYFLSPANPGHNHGHLCAHVCKRGASRFPPSVSELQTLDFSDFDQIVLEHFSSVWFDSLKLWTFYSVWPFKCKDKQTPNSERQSLDLFCVE